MLDKLKPINIIKCSVTSPLIILIGRANINSKYYFFKLPFNVTSLAGIGK